MSEQEKKIYKQIIRVALELEELEEDLLTDTWSEAIETRARIIYLKIELTRLYELEEEIKPIAKYPIESTYKEVFNTPILLNHNI